jgi:gliding motility-associated-like protein
MIKAQTILPVLFFLSLAGTNCLGEVTGDTCIVRAGFSPDRDTVVADGTPFFLINQSINATSYSWYINGAGVSSATDLTLSPVAGVNEIMLVAFHGTCADTVYSYIIREAVTSGGNANIKKQFNPPGLPMDPFCIAGDKANGYLLAGDYGHPASALNPAKTTGLIRIDENGCVMWSKSMIPDEEEVIQSIISTSDTGYLVSAFPFQAANANYTNPLSVFKLDKGGNVQWARSYGSGVSVSNYLSALYETDDKGFLFEIGSFPAGGNPSYLSIVRTDPQGIVVWGHQLSMESDALYNIGGIIEKNGSVYATGSMKATVAPFQLLRSFLTRMDMGTGQTIWTKQNDPAQPGLNFTDLHNYKNGLLINSFTGNQLNNLLYTDNDGNVLGSSMVNNPYGSLNGKGNILVTTDNELYFHQYSGSSAGPYKDIIMRLDGNQQISWQVDLYSQNPAFTGLNQIAPAPAGGMAAIGSGLTANGQPAISFLKLDSTGALCNSGNSGLSISTNSQALIPMTWNNDAAISIDVSNLPQYPGPLTIESHSFCSNGCDLLKLEGPRVLCQLDDTARYILHSDPSCPDPISWVFDQTNISVVFQSSRGLEVRFKRPGTYLLKAEKNGCVALADSITVTVGNTLSGVVLPEDTILCSGHSLVLDAGAGYNSYLWQDGSTGQNIRVAAAGTYWVKLGGTHCANTDTILVTVENCAHTIYFPNAFTPNGDGHNDLFKPVLSVHPVFYHFSIYNRRGQRIFDTTDPYKGWDGRIGDHDQGTGTYVWICTYQFAGDKKISRRGDLTLIH